MDPNDRDFFMEAKEANRRAMIDLDAKHLAFVRRWLRYSWILYGLIIVIQWVPAPTEVWHVLMASFTTGINVFVFVWSNRKFRQSVDDITSRIAKARLLREFPYDANT